MIVHSTRRHRSGCPPWAPVRRMAAAFVIIALALPASVVSAQTSDPRDQALWDETAGPYLAADLWNDSVAYDACHYMMVPLHAAFRLNNAAWQSQLESHFTRFINGGTAALSDVGLNRLQYLYLASRYVALCSVHNKRSSIPAGLVNFLYRELNDFWLVRPAWSFNSPDFKGMKERLKYKLTVGQVDQSYFRAVLDHEMHLLAIAADLRTYERFSGKTSQYTPVVTEALAYARAVFDQRFVGVRGVGFVFQPGAWTDYEDYLYAGHADKTPGMSPIKVPGIGPDSPHSMRLPAWITSLCDAYSPDVNDRVYWENAKSRMESTLFGVSLLPPGNGLPGYATTNYTDGHNGVYRWMYSAPGFDGYGPYEASGHLTMGWWTLLDTPRIKAVYREMAAMFPVSDELAAFYQFDTEAPEYDRAFRELIIRLASRVPASPLK